MNFTLMMAGLIQAILTLGLYYRGVNLWGVAALVVVLIFCAMGLRMLDRYTQMRGGRRPWYAP